MAVWLVVGAAFGGSRRGMRKRNIVPTNNPVRSWGRRAVYGMRVRPDVQVLKLERRLRVLESVVDLDARAPWMGELLELLAPRQFTRVPLERLGSLHDGGYVLPRSLPHECAGVVSIGVGDNNDVDVALAERGLQVHAWDHTVADVPTAHPMIAFHRMGLGEGSASLLTLNEITEASFGPTSGSLALMLDVEGAEWEALGRAQDSDLDRFALISLEMHGLGDLLVDPNPILAVLRRLHQRFVPVAVHPNNYGAVWTLGGVELCDALEVTYVSRQSVQGDGVPGNCPAALLSPCCPDLPDVHLGWAPSAAV